MSFSQYSLTLRSPLIWDSKSIILEDQTIHDLSNIPGFFFQNSAPPRRATGVSVGDRMQFYRPVMKSILALEYALWGASPFAYHAVSVLLNCIVVLLFFFLAIKLTGSTDIAFWASLLYAVNPARGEAVNWVYSASSLWMAIFIFVAIQCYHARKLIWAVSAFGLAFLSRESALLLLPALVIYERVFTPGDSWSVRIRRLSPLLASGVLLLMLRSAVVAFPHGSGISVLAHTNAVTLGIARFFKIFAIPDSAVAHYLLINIPVSAFAITLSYFIVVGVVSLAVLLWLKDKRLFFWFAWGCIWLGLLLNVGGAGQYWLTEKMLYVGSAGFCIVIASVMLKRRRWGKWVLASLVLMHFAVTFWRTTYWQDEIEHLRAVLDFSPNYTAARYTLATDLAVRGACEFAVPEFRKVLEDVPNNSLALNNLALCYHNLGQSGLAEETWLHAHFVDPANPNPALNLGVLAELQGRRADALRFFRAYLDRATDPNSEVIDRIAALEQELGLKSVVP